mmetsp:Transcript_61785/g.130427  ORF Transcript_61785/g.130427 Transcript_61785/m.130427 type:complete len:111 (-) Transcript_61785:482-814(-)
MPFFLVIAYCIYPPTGSFALRKLFLTLSTSPSVSSSPSPSLPLSQQTHGETRSDTWLPQILKLDLDWFVRIPCAFHRQLFSAGGHTCEASCLWSANITLTLCDPLCLLRG